MGLTRDSGKSGAGRGCSKRYLVLVLYLLLSLRRAPSVRLASTVGRACSCAQEFENFVG
jgi:hypothetical protein